MSPTKADSLIPYPDGRLKLTLDGKPYTLRRPTIGEQWEFDEAYALLMAAEIEDREWAKDILVDSGHNFDEANPLTVGMALVLVKSIVPVDAQKRQQARQALLVEWWLNVFEKLGSNLPALIMEDLPPFLKNYETVTLAQEAWARNPQGPGDE